MWTADLVKRCDEAGYWPTDFSARAIHDAKCEHVRAWLRDQQDARQRRLWESLDTVKPDGAAATVYKHVSALTVDEFRTQIERWAARGRHCFSRAADLQQLCFEFHGEQLSVPAG